MPASVLSPLSRGYGAWTGELHLAENDKGPGPSLPSLLPDDPYCHHSGVTVRPRAKSAVSAFSIKSQPETPRRQFNRSENGERELLLPKTYLTRKGAIVLFAAPENIENVELSERDKLYMRKARKKLLKHRYVDYSNKIGSIQRLTQSVLAFGDDDYVKETTSITDVDNKVFLKFKRPEEKDTDIVDKHSQPGYNVDMYLNDLMSRSGTRPSTAAPIMDWRNSADLPPHSESAGSSMESPDLLSIDSEYLVKYMVQPPSTPTGDGDRASPVRPRRMSADKLAASLKSGGFLGRQTIMEEDNIRSRSKTGSVSQIRRESVHSRKKSRSSSVLSTNKQILEGLGTPDVSEVHGIQVDHSVADLQEDEYYLSEDAEEEEEYDQEDGQHTWQAGKGLTQPLMPSYNPVMDLSLLSGGSGGGTFSFELSTANNVAEDQVFVEDPVAQALSKQNSLASMRSEHKTSERSSVTHIAGSRPPSSSLADQASTTNVVEDVSVLPVEVEEVLEEDRNIDESTTHPITDNNQQVSVSEVSDAAGLKEQQLIDKEDDPERPISVASSHSGVFSFAENEEEQTSAVDVNNISEAAELKTQDSKSEGDIETDVVKEEATLAEVLDEAVMETRTNIGEITTKTDTLNVEPLPEYLTLRGDREEFVSGDGEKSSHKALSITSSLSENLRPEPGVTEVRITPRSSATIRTEPTTAAAEAIPKSENQKATENIKQTEITKQKIPEPKAVKQEPAKVDLTKKAEPSTPATTSTDTKPPLEVVKKKTPPVQTATHMTQARKEPPKEKPPPPKPKSPPDEKKPVLDSAPKEKSTKEEKASEEKKAKEEQNKTAEKEKKEKQKLISTPKKEKVPEKKPEPPKKEIVKPENLLSDTKAEIARLFGNTVPKAPPVKVESAREKKERLKRDIGPRVVRKPKPPTEAKATKEDKELDELEKKVMAAIGDRSSAIPVDEEGGGLTVEEMELEQQIMKQKLEEADAKLKGKNVEDKGKGTPRGKKGKKAAEPQAEQDLIKKREEIREAKRLEKQKRLEEAKRVEEELKKKEEEKKRALENAKARTKYISEDVQEMKRQAEEAERAEEEARLALQESRRIAREERDKKRKDEQEKKKNEMIQKREDERKRVEAGRQREQDMLMKLASHEERRRMAEDTRRRKEEMEEQAMIEEEEQKVIQREEERNFKLQMEEDEAKIADAEREAEEEAMSRLVTERDEALRKKRQMEEMQRRLADEEEAKRKEYEVEQKKIEENRLKKEEEERLRREEEKKRLRELQRMEDEAREKMKQEMQRRREALLRRREVNLERKSHLDSLKAKQGLNKGWVFSYYVHWPRETYERRMGNADDKKKRGKSAPAKTRSTQS